MPTNSGGEAGNGDTAAVLQPPPETPQPEEPCATGTAPESEPAQAAKQQPPPPPAVEALQVTTAAADSSAVPPPPAAAATPVEQKAAGSKAQSQARAAPARSMAQRAAPAFGNINRAAAAAVACAAIFAAAIIALLWCAPHMSPCSICSRSSIVWGCAFLPSVLPFLAENQQPEIWHGLMSNLQTSGMKCLILSPARRRGYLATLTPAQPREEAAEAEDAVEADDVVVDALLSPAPAGVPVPRCLAAPSTR